MASGGDEIIPASRRPDGTWRKERKVKTGYVPPDEVEKYESRGKKFLNELPKFPPGYVPPADQSKPMTKNQKKNEKKKQKRKEKVEAEEASATIVDDEAPKKLSEDVSKLKMTSDDTGQSDNSDVLKKIKGLKKKLKQIDQLIERKSKGEILEKEQLDKITKRKEFEEELENLELELE